MEIGTVFSTSTATPDHIRAAEELGYEYAFVYDSPAIYADPWITLARAAERTTRIRIGVGVVTPRLRHLVANAGAAATLASLAPGRVDLGVGAGFTSQAMLGQKGARWTEVEEYVRGLRTLLRGDELERDGATIALRHSASSGVVLPAEVPLWVAAHGPKGYAVAERVADAVLTNLGHGSANVFTKLPRVFIVHYGTVLEDGESLASERVLAAAGPAAALHLHLADNGAAAGMEECAAYHERLARVDERRRHLELHRSHLIEVTELERPFVTPALIERTTGTGTLDRVREQLLEMRQAGATGVLYGPIGPDIPRELSKFAEAASAVR